MVLTTLALTASGVQAAFTLAAGERAAPIYVTRDVAPVVDQAVADLVRYVEVCTGARPALRRVAGPIGLSDLDGPAVLIGAAAGLVVTRQQAGFDGYRMVVTDRHVRLAGPTDDGTANAVYDLLLTGLGVRFLVPGDDGVLAPSQREVRIPETDRTERPAFDFRFPWYNESVLRGHTPAGRQELRRFIRRNRGMGLQMETRHYFADLVPAALHFDEHPEYFAEVQGRRLAHGQLCTSQPHVIHLAAEHWIDRFDRQPELEIGSLSANDRGLFCTCDACQLANPDLGARLVTFMNEVTRRVSRRHPDRRLSFYAYGPLTAPTGIRLHPNLIAGVTRYNICQAHAVENAACPSNREFLEQLNGWERDATRILVREFACWWFLPDLAIDVLAGNLRTYKQHRALGVSREYLHRGFGSDLMRYIDLQLMWDPSANPDRLLDDFLAGRFGPADTGVRRVVDTFRNLLESTDPGRLVRGNRIEIAKVYRTATLRSGVQELEQLAAATPGIHGQRVAVEAEMLRAALDFRRITELTHRYSITGRQSDFDQLRQVIAETEERFADLESAGVLGAGFGHELAELRHRVEGPGLGAPIDGRFDYEDDLAHGGFSQRDAERIEGFYAGQHGLALLPRKTGRIAYTLTAAPGRHFTGAELRRLVFRGSSSRIEVKTDDGLHLFAENAHYSDLQHTYDLTPLIDGTERFTLIFWANNRGSRPLLCLDNWGIEVTTE